MIWLTAFTRRPQAGAALLLALCMGCPSAGCAGDAPAPTSSAHPVPLPGPAATPEDEPASSDSSSEPAEMSSSEPAEASSSEPAEAHSAARPVVHHHHHRKKKPRPPPATSTAKPPPVASTPPPPPPKPASNVRPIGPEDITSVLGKMVVDASGNELGRVVNILVDAKAHVRAVVVDFGGFLGVGNRQIAVNWDLLEFRPGAGDKSLVLKVSRDQVENAPSFQESPHPDAVEGPAAPAPPPPPPHPAAPAPAAPAHPAPPAPARSGK